MTQADFTIPANQNGTALRNEVTNAMQAITTGNKGGSAPTYAVVGMTWIDDSASPIWKFNYYDGTSWNFIGSMNTSTNVWTPANAVLVNGSNLYAVDSGAANAYVATLSPALTALGAGQVINFLSGHANTGASTLNVNGLGVKAIKKSGATALATGDILSGVIYTCMYDGTNFQLVAPVSPTLLLTKSYDSADKAISIAGTWTLAHGMGLKPKIIMLYLHCLTSELGYTAGQEYLIGAGVHESNGNANQGSSIVSDATNIVVRFGSQTGGVYGIINGGTGSDTVSITNANWALIVRAYA
jgi:hypothetical protein